MTTYPASADPAGAFTRADGTTEAHSVDHGRVIGIWENVKHHGAKGDGVTDDSVSIRAAHSTGHAVYYPYGQYVYNSATPLTINSWDYIIGAGREGSAIIFSGSAAIQFASAAHHVTLRDIRLTTSGTADLLTLAGSQISGLIADRVELLSTVTTNRLFYATAASIVGTRWTNCYFECAAAATVAPISLSGAVTDINGNFFYNPTFQTNGSLSGVHFVELTNGTQAVFRDVLVESGQDGVFKLTSMSDCIVDGMHLYDSVGNTTASIVYEVSGCVRNSFENLYSDAAFGAGTYMVDASGGTDTHIKNAQWNSVPFKMGTRTSIFGAAAGGNISGTAHNAIFQYGPIYANDGLRLFQKAGAVVDGDFNQVADGILAVDTTNSKLYVRVGGTWKSVTVA